MRLLNTLDRPEREQQVVQMHRILSEHLPAFPTHFAAHNIAHVSALHGPEPGLASAGVFSPETSPHWNSTNGSGASSEEAKPPGGVAW